MNKPNLNPSYSPSIQLLLDVMSFNDAVFCRYAGLLKDLLENNPEFCNALDDRFNSHRIPEKNFNFVKFSKSLDIFDLSSSAFKLLSLLACYMSSTGHIRASTAVLQALTGFSRNTVYSALEELKSRDLLFEIELAGSSHNEPTVYRINSNYFSKSKYSNHDDPTCSNELPEFVEELCKSEDLNGNVCFYTSLRLA